MSMILDDPQVCIPDLIANHARVQPAREAVVCGAVRRSWGDFDRNISRIANALLAAGLVRGDRVVVMMGNRVEMLEAVFGIVRAGGCAVPLSGLLTGPQLAGLVADSGAVAPGSTRCRTRCPACVRRCASRSRRPARPRRRAGARSRTSRTVRPTPHPASSACLATRSTSSTARAPPACPRASCIAIAYAPCTPCCSVRPGA
ncbi:MAG: acyl--CoA ligase [Rhodocyclales bacterium]|nr:acyl--CoA ligase [Rhodocyclales bacterium]